jgi:hypothetical protein
MLGNAMRKYILNENNNSHNKDKQRVYKNRIRTYAKTALKDLTLLAQKLPEEEQAEIFNENNLTPLFKALLQPNPEEMTTLENDTELTKKKRQRLIPICYSLITTLNKYNLSHLIAPVGTRYMISNNEKLAFIKAIFYRCQSSRDDQE